MQRAVGGAVPPPASPLDPVPLVAEPPPVARSRAGRDLPAAIGVGVGLALVVLASLYVERAAFVVVVAAAVVVGVRELAGALAVRGVRLPVVPVAAGGAAMVVSAYRGGEDGLTLALGLTVLGVLLWCAATRREGFARDATAGVFAALYVPFLAGYAALLVRAPDGADRVVLFVLVVVASDVGGYAAGATLGRHPMAPAISPKKSWEGFGGSVLGCVVLGAAAAPLLVGAAWWQGALLGSATVLTATLGDLGESLVKRDLGIKDMGAILPGHGGVMDRLDSLLPSAPVAFLVLALVLGA